MVPVHAVISLFYERKVQARTSLTQVVLISLRARESDGLRLEIQFLNYRYCRIFSEKILVSYDLLVAVVVV